MARMRGVRFESSAPPIKNYAYGLKDQVWPGMPERNPDDVMVTQKSQKDSEPQVVR